MMPQKCTYCFADLRRNDNQTKDHVFPRKWYPANTDPKAQRPTVHSCVACNRRFKVVEDRLRRCWGLTLATRSDVAADIGAAELRAIRPWESSDLRSMAYRTRRRRALFRDMK